MLSFINKKLTVLIMIFLLASSCSQTSREAKHAITKAETWLDTLDVDLNDIAKRKFGDKKRLAEVLGAYWAIHRYADSKKQQQIKAKLSPLYDYTKKPQYIDFLISADDKNFKKNSMSYLRIMWLLQAMDYDITHLRFGFARIKKRMDAHFRVRGPWQKGIFERYYDTFGFKKPRTITNTKNMKGPISARATKKQYEKKFTAYQLTHQIFVAFMYGSEKNQDRFNKSDLNYLSAILPEVTQHYIEKKNWDLASELLVCMTYLKQTKHPVFKSSYIALIEAQNSNGSWGDYKRLTKKYGKYVDVNFYLHTTGVVIGALIEQEYGEWE